MNKFHPKWEVLIENEEVVAQGTWFYQNQLPYKATLIKQNWNYTSLDVAELDEILEIPFCDYIDFSISDEGVLYYWKFVGPNNETVSPTFPTYFQARDHINTYGYKYEIQW